MRMTATGRLRFQREVDAFLAGSGLSPSRFSREATGDPGFVRHLRMGIPQIGPVRIARARAFMREWRQ